MLYLLYALSRRQGIRHKSVASKHCSIAFFLESVCSIKLSFLEISKHEYWWMGPEGGCNVPAGTLRFRTHWSRSFNGIPAFAPGLRWPCSIPDLILWLQSNFNNRDEPFHISLAKFIHATTLLARKSQSYRKINISGTHQSSVHRYGDFLFPFYLC